MNEILVGSAVFTAIVLTLALVVIAARAIVLPSRAVTVTVNGSRRIETRTGQKLLDVLKQDDIPVPSACAGAGTCGLCRVTVTEGGGETLPTEAARLSNAEMHAGMRLSCQVTVRNDMQVGVAEEILNVESFTCTLAESRMLSPLIREVVLDMPDGRPFEFHAGAFVQVTAPPYKLDFSTVATDDGFRAEWERLGIGAMTAGTDTPVTRAYSVANIPADTNRIVMFVRLAVPPPSAHGAPPGVVSSFLFGLKPGDPVTVSGPYGTFKVQDTDREMVFIGGGVGMAPLRSMIFDQLERVGTSRKITFWYGARSRADLFRSEEFDELAARHENFDWTVALSDPAEGDGWNGPTGFIHTVAYKAYLEAHPAPEDCEYYLCGPPLMIQAVLRMLDECGVDETAIFNDDFGA